jgi:hypothetical protein
MTKLQYSRNVYGTVSGLTLGTVYQGQIVLLAGTHEAFICWNDDEVWATYELSLFSPRAE